MAANSFMGTGRRKEAVARVRLVPGKGEITVNGKLAADYFQRKILERIILQPLEATKQTGNFDVVATVKGGGISGQAGALRHGIARALLTVDEDYRIPMKKAGFLTRDSRMKERRKYGLKKARKAPQFSKR